MSVGAVVLGILNGLTIGLLAVGLVLVYKSNRFLNLAHAQLGTLSALLVAKWVIDSGWNWWAAFVIAVAVGIGTGLVVERFLVAPLRERSSSPIRLLLLSLGVSQLLLAITYIPDLGPDTSKTTLYPQPFHSSLRIGDVTLTGMYVLAAILVPILVAALAAFMRYSVLGKQIRAAANNPDAARLSGISVRRVSAVTWALAGGFSAVSAVLTAPTQASFNVASLGPNLLMVTLGAAAFGAFTSLPGALGGGLLLGLVNQLVAAQTSSAPKAELAMFALILVIVLVRGKAIGRVFQTSGAAVDDVPVTRVPASVRTSGLVRHHRVFLAASALLVAVVMPLLPYFNTAGHRFLLSLVLIFALVGVGLTMLLGWGGQVSLGHFAVVGLGAYITAHLSTHWSLAALFLAAGAVGAGVMVLVGLPALRVRGLTLAVTTLGLAVMSTDWLFHQSWVGSDKPFGMTVEAPRLGPGLGTPGSEVAVYYVALVVLGLAVLAAGALRRSNPGRLFFAVRDNERASAAFGANPATVKLAILAVSGFFAGTAGVLWADAWKSVTPLHFTADVSIAVIAIPVIGGLGSIAGAVAAAVALYGGTFFLGPHVSGLFGDFGQNLGFSLFLAGGGVTLSLLKFPTGIAGAAQAAWQRYVDRRAGVDAESLEVAPAEAAADVAEEAAAQPARTDVSVRIDDVGGIVANADGSVAHAGHGISGVLRRAGVAAGYLDRRDERLHGTRPDSDPTVPLEVTGVRVRFGGVVALDEPDITVRRGEIVGLIGANGAGKTTLMNVISGVIRSAGGSVCLFGAEVADLPPDLRCAAGLSRSFQDASLFAGLTVTETLQVVISQRHKVGVVSAMLGAPWVKMSERRIRRQAEDIVARFGLTPWADIRTSELSTGTRRVCELAAQVAARPKLLLLDEPTAGVAQREAEAFGPLLRKIRDELDCAILIVEHDMPLLMGLCDRMYALETGHVIAEGTPEEMRRNDRVVASYLGTEETAITRSGKKALATSGAPRASRRGR